MSDEVKAKWKLQLSHLAPNGGEEPTLLEGRGAYESGNLATMRPVPPPVTWSPTVGEPCELSFDHGWWKVRVVERDASGQWVVLYVPASATHTVPSERLRPVASWDQNNRAWCKIGRR